MRSTPLTSSVNTKELSEGRISASTAFLTLRAFLGAFRVYVPQGHTYTSRIVKRDPFRSNSGSSDAAYLNSTRSSQLRLSRA
jgi:hypothetical protein